MRMHRILTALLLLLGLAVSAQAQQPAPTPAAQGTYLTPPAAPMVPAGMAPAAPSPAVATPATPAGTPAALNPEDPLAGAEAPIDLQAAVERSLLFNPQIESARFQLSGSEYGRKSALGAMGPSATTSYGYTRHDRPTVSSTSGRVSVARDQWIYSLNVTQPIFHGFALLSAYQKAKLAKEQAKAQLDNAELILIQTVQDSFLQLLQARMDVKSSEDSVARLRSQLQVTQAFYDVGLKPKLDVLQAEVDLATAEQQLLTAKNSVATQTAQLNTLIGLPLEYPARYVGELTYIPFQRTLDDCLARAYTKRPDLEIGRKSVEMAQKDAKIAAGTFYPNVDASYDYSQTGDTPRADGTSSYSKYASEWSVGAKATWNFFSSGKDFNAYEQAKETVAKVEADLADTRLNAGFSVKQDLLDLQVASDRISVAKKSIAAAQEGYRMAVARYQAQVGTNTEVLDAQSRLSSAEFQLSSALADYQRALSRLYVAMGERNLALSMQ